MKPVAPQGWTRTDYTMFEVAICQCKGDCPLPYRRDYRAAGNG